ALDARLHAGPPDRREGRACCAPRLLRPRARPLVPGPRLRAAGLPRRARTTERRAAPRAALALRPERARAVDRARRGARRGARRAAARGARTPGTTLRRAGGGAGPAGRAARLRGRAT